MGSAGEFAFMSTTHVLQPCLISLTLSVHWVHVFSFYKDGVLQNLLEALLASEKLEIPLSSDSGQNSHLQEARLLELRAIFAVCLALSCFVFVLLVMNFFYDTINWDHRRSAPLFALMFRVMQLLQT